jgi:DNA ligase 4
LGDAIRKTIVDCVMPFRFMWVCDLLENLQDIRDRDPPQLPRGAKRKSNEAIEKWFAIHRQRIDNETDGLTLLSTLLPEDRKDRVYLLQERNLEKVIGRVLALPNSRRIDLERWREPGAGDLGDCVERVQKQGVRNVSVKLRTFASYLLEQRD